MVVTKNKGFDDVDFVKDKDDLEHITMELNNLSVLLQEEKLEEEEAILKAFHLLERYKVLSFKIMAYVSIKQSFNTLDSETTNQRTGIETMISESSKPMSVIQKYIAKSEHLDEYMTKHPQLKEYDFFISQVKRDAKYLLEDEVENVIVRLNISAGSAWNNMQSFLTSIKLRCVKTSLRDNSQTICTI